MIEMYNDVRPEVMESVTESQLEELRLQFDDFDRGQFDRLVELYGWTRDDADQIWNFFTAGDLQRFTHDIP